MPANTPNRNYPYPLDTDSIDVAQHIEDLATVLDTDFDDVLATVDNKVSVTGDTMTGQLTLPGAEPTSLNHALSKKWGNSYFLNKGGDAMSGDLDMNGNNVIGLGAPTGDNMATRKSYVDNLNANVVKKDVTGTQTMVGALRADYFLIDNPESPNGPFQAATKKYVDDTISDAVGLTRAEADVRYVNVNGDVMTGALQIGGDWASEENAVIIRPNLGNYRSTVLSTVAGPSMLLNRSDAANAAGQTYIAFAVDVDTIIGSIVKDPGDPGHTPDPIPGTNSVKYNETSDYRLKENFGPVADAAARVRTLAGRVFRGGAAGASRPYSDMLNAHDIAEVAPYAVTGRKDAVNEDGRIVPQQVAYTGLIPLLTAALGEALERIDQLEARLA